MKKIKDVNAEGKKKERESVQTGIVLLDSPGQVRTWTTWYLLVENACFSPEPKFCKISIWFCIILPGEAQKPCCNMTKSSHKISFEQNIKHIPVKSVIIIILLWELPMRPLPGPKCGPIFDEVSPVWCLACLHKCCNQAVFVAVDTFGCQYLACNCKWGRTHWCKSFFLPKCKNPRLNAQVIAN